MTFDTEIDLLGALPVDLERPDVSEDLLALCVDLLDPAEPGDGQTNHDAQCDDDGTGGVQFISADRMQVEAPATSVAMRRHVGHLEAQLGVALPKGAQWSGPGWASVAGDESFDYPSLDELRVIAPNVTFIMAKAPAASDGDIESYPWLRGPDFFSTSLDDLAGELGFKLSTLIAENGAACTCMLSEIASRSVEVFPTIFSGLSLKSGPCKSIKDEVVNNFLATPDNYVGVNEEVLQASASLRHTPISFGKTTRIRDITLRLRVNRFEHLAFLASKAVPGESWFEVSKSDFHLDKWFDDDADPVILKVSMRPFRKGSIHLFGDSVQRNVMQVAWISGPEMKALMPFVTLKVNRMIAASGCMSSAKAFGLDEITANPFRPSSISAGLASESFIHAMCADFSSPASELLAIRSNWLNSVARSACLKAALPLANLGISILDVGLSHVDVALPKQKLPLLRSYMHGDTSLRMPVIDEAEYD